MNIMRFLPVDVVTKDGYKTGESPAFVTDRWKKLKIIRIIDRWYEASTDEKLPTVSYFKVILEILVRHIGIY